MPGLFDKKFWNDEVFQKYLETIPNTRMNMLLKSGAIVQHPEYAKPIAITSYGTRNVKLNGFIPGYSSTVTIQKYVDE